MFCYDFALKMTNIMITCSHVYLLGEFEGMVIAENVGKWRNFEVYFDMIFPSENYRNLHLFDKKNNAIVAKLLLGSLGKE